MIFILCKMVKIVNFFYPKDVKQEIGRPDSLSGMRKSTIFFQIFYRVSPSDTSTEIVNRFSSEYTSQHGIASLFFRITKVSVSMLCSDYTAIKRDCITTLYISACRITLAASITSIGEDYLNQSLMCSNFVIRNDMCIYS